jgi:hypothetical protein
MTKVKAIALALFVAGFGASYAFAGDGHGNGNGHGHGKGNDAAVSTSTSTSASAACRPNVAFVLNGTFVSAASDGSFSMTVAHANHHARALGSPVTVATDAKTRIRRNGKVVAVSDLQAGDRLNVQARGCKNAAAGTAQALVARRVVAHPASGHDGETTTTDTETETDTTTNP